jgi:hypothetical protein
MKFKCLVSYRGFIFGIELINHDGFFDKKLKKQSKTPILSVIENFQAINVQSIFS